MDNIKTVSLARLRANHDIPSIGDHLLYFGDIKMMPQLKEPRRMNCIIVGLCTEGQGGYELNQEKFVLKKGDALILTDGQIVDQVWMDPDTQGFALLISKELMDEIFKEIKASSGLFLLAREHPIFQLNEDEMRKTRQYMDIIGERINGPEYEFKKEVIRLLLIALVYDLGTAIMRVMNSSGKEANTKGKKCFAQFIQLVEQNFRKERRVSWYAKKMGLTPKYLSEIISSTSKRTPNDWIDKYVTTEIRNLLSNTDKKISEIANEMNFPSQSFLGKYFRENVGMSPSEYRKSQDK